MSTYDKAVYEVVNGFKYRLPPDGVRTDPASNGRVGSVSTEGFVAAEDGGPIEGRTLLINDSAQSGGSDI